MSEIKLRCPICNFEETATVEWLMTTEKVCCRNCGKSSKVEEFNQNSYDYNEGDPDVF